jgi:HSP20 family protein
MTTAHDVSTRNTDRPALLPAVDVFEDAHGITLVADMPGADRDGLAIEVDGDTLTLQADMNLGADAGMQPVYAEVRAPRYSRRFTLSRDLDSAHIDAALKDGVLTLRVPKFAQAQPRRVEVRAG